MGTSRWAGAAGAALILACGGGLPAVEPATTGEPAASSVPATADPVVPIDFVGSNLLKYPTPGIGSTVLAAVDDHPATVWSLAPGEVGLFQAPTRSTSGVQIVADGPVEVRPSTKDRFADALGEPWVAVPPSPGVAEVALPAGAWGVEVRSPAGARVASVALRGPLQGIPSPSGWWTVAGDTTVERSTSRFERVDVETCQVYSPQSGPPGTDQRLTGTCARTADGLKLRGELPGIGSIDETVPVVKITANLALIDGHLFRR